MILSDVDIRKAFADGRIGIDPFDEADVQPSSVDLHVDRFFRTFHNARYPFIDVKKPMEELTELVEVAEDEAFILHPGEFVLGSTSEYVRLPNDLVARLEGKSSLGRLGLLIHSSLPGDEPVPYLQDGDIRLVPIGDIVRKHLDGSVVAFDPETFEIGFHEVTGFHESPPDRIFEVVLATGRSVRLTGGHDLFTLDRNGELTKLRVHELSAGSRVAIAGRIPDPVGDVPFINLITLAPESAYDSLTCGGPTIERAWQLRGRALIEALLDQGIGHYWFYRQKAFLPLNIALEFGLGSELGPEDWLSVRGGRHRIAAQIQVNAEVAWLLGLYVAEGSCRRNQVVLSNHDQAILDRAQEALSDLGLTVYRTSGAITCCSTMLAYLMEWLKIGPKALSKRVPWVVFGWPQELLQSFLEGFVDGDGSREAIRISLWTSSDGLVGDLLLLCSRLGLRAGASQRVRNDRPLWHPMWQISVPYREHKLLASVPHCPDLLIQLRRASGLTQVEGAKAAGFKHNTQLNNIERLPAQAVRLRTLRRLRAAYAPADPPGIERLSRLVDGAIRWDTVKEIRDTGRIEPVFDLEVRPSGRRIENFLAGYGGVFVSNTAGYVDPGFEGHLTLELSNVANLPITIYPKMKIGQISFFQLTSEAENPYGSKKVGSKYQGQKGPTPSRYYENFK